MIYYLVFIASIVIPSLNYARNISADNEEPFSNHVYTPSGERRLVEMAKKTAATLYKDETGIREQVYPNGDTPIIGKDGRRFLHIKVDGDGDCALHSFGTTRPEVVKVLLDIVDSANKSFDEHKAEVLKQENLTAFLENIKAIKSYQTVKDLVNLFNTDMDSLKQKVQFFSQDPWIKTIAEEIEKIEAEIVRLRTEENLILAQTISDLNKKISDENNKKKEEQEKKKLAQWSKEKEDLYVAHSGLKINFHIFEDVYEKIASDLKNKLPHAYKFHYFTQFINGFLAAINTRIEDADSKNLLYLHSNTEKML